MDRGCTADRKIAETNVGEEKNDRIVLDNWIRRRMAAFAARDFAETRHQYLTARSV